jgi:methylenetetrahydrofolate dehydrogenase (NADP+)/methenyltetrahydrofolate cyclohydrolase
MAIIMDGKGLSDKIKNELKERVAKIDKIALDNSVFHIFQFGDNPASNTYVGNKIKSCEYIGIPYKLHKYPNEDGENGNLYDFYMDISQSASDFFNDTRMLQLPAPDVAVRIANDYNNLKPEGDVDGFSALSPHIPCTPKGIIRLLEEYNIDITGKHCVIVGRSEIVGRPMAKLMLDRDATVTVCHSKTRDLEKFTKDADILIVAVGKPKFITEDMVKEGAVVIDVGINRVDGKLCGDVDFENVEPKCYAITPVPKGVGAMTVAMLMENIVEQIEAGESEVVNE